MLIQVITYMPAYPPMRPISLCEAHVASPPMPLGQVDHTWHDGVCDVCEQEARAAEGDV